jgi:hypothetical protein
MTCGGRLYQLRGDLAKLETAPKMPLTTSGDVD